MSIRIGEYGKKFRVNTDFDLSGNSELTLIFTRPDLTTFNKTSADGVVAPGVPVTDPDTGETFEANEYMEYLTASGDIDQTGQWTVQAQYDDITPKRFIGDVATFTVLA